MRKYENELLSGGGSTDRARESLTWAVQLSGDEGPPQWFLLPKTVDVATLDRAEFKKLLDSARAINIDDAPDQPLSNIIAQRRARWLPWPNGQAIC